MFSGCQSKSKEISIIDRVCPVCGHEVELFSHETEARCEHCGFTVFNDTLSCVQWCKYARQCVGDAMYERMQRVVAHQKQLKEQGANA